MNYPTGRMSWRAIAAVMAVGALVSCGLLTEPRGPLPPQTVTLFATPKILSDFASPEAGVNQFLDHYSPLIRRASETIVIFAVGNSQHILTYRGRDYWRDTVEWARYTDGFPVSDRVLDYQQVGVIVRAFKDRAAALGLNVKVFDQVDQTVEMAREHFRLGRHPECTAVEWEHTFDIRGRMTRDTFTYASAPDGIQEGSLCGEFLAAQVAHYTHDLGFDGILYGNQLGTRGHWQPDSGPGYSVEEAKAILDFLAYSRRVYANKEIMWFDSYNNLQVESETYSFPIQGYGYFNYVIASGFCVITFPERYIDNLKSKLQLRNRTRVLATLDYVDPWYTYDSMNDFPEESARLENIAIQYRYDIDGIVFFANDDRGVPVPRALIELFADRFFGPPPG